MDIEVGSNLYRNSDGTIEIEGVPQMTVALRKPGGPLLISFVMFDEQGRVIAKIVDSSLAFNEKRAFDLSRTQTGLVMKQTEGGKIALQIDLKAGDRVAIPKGDFITIKGHRLEITPTEWRIGSKRSSGQETDVQGKSVSID